MKHYVIPIFVPHLGCPHDCVFCDQQKITSLPRAKGQSVTGRDVERIAGEYLRSFRDEGASVEIAFFGGTFTGIPRDIQADLLHSAQKFLRRGEIAHIRCSTRPDCIDASGLEFVKSYGMDIIELGVQSLDDDVLLKSGRGHSAASVQAASRLILGHGLTLGHQLMLGLPGDSPDKDLESARRSIEMKPHMVRLYPALVVKGTPMEAMYSRGEYAPYSLDLAIETCAQIMELYESAGIKVIRAGLQATEEFRPGRALTAGPYHPAFKELVISHRFWHKLYLECLKFQGSFADHGKLENPGMINHGIIIGINPQDISAVYAGGKQYRNLFKDQLAGLGKREFSLQVIQDKTIERGTAETEIFGRRMRLYL